jgi:hypothetical protein
MPVFQVEFFNLSKIENCQNDDTSLVLWYLEYWKSEGVFLETGTETSLLRRTPCKIDVQMRTLR